MSTSRASYLPVAVFLAACARAPAGLAGAEVGNVPEAATVPEAGLADAPSAAERPATPDAVAVRGEAPPPGALSIRVSGNHLVDGSGKIVVLHGVNRSGQEFECAQGGSSTSRGWGLFDGPTDLASAQAIASWHANVVRVVLNEDCWLGINGINPTWGGPAYQAAIQQYVATLHQAGLYVILDMHWNAPATFPALAQQPMPDADHAPAFWQSVATAFKGDPAVLFDLYNEPFLYGSYLQSSSEDPWTCWLDGCGINQFLTGGSPYTMAYDWNAVGMQALVDTVRAAGAGQPIMVSGLDWANDMSGWLTHEPKDPLGQLVASWHSYPGESCDTMSCWTSVIQPLAAKVPIVVGETGDNVCCAAPYMTTFLPWADAQGISYLGWTWNTWGDCQDILIKDYTGTPTTNYGQEYRTHLLGL